MIHEIYPHRFNNQYLTNKDIEDMDFVLHYKGNSLLLKTIGDEVAIPYKKDFSQISEKTKTTFLFTLNDVPYFIIWDELKAEKPKFVFKEINFFRGIKRQEITWICVVGFHLMKWYQQNRFCGKCGTRTQPKRDERAIVCPHCKRTIFPKIAPAIIVAVLCNDKILLARDVNFPGNWYSLIAGYVDVGESLEETVIREVKEEVGLKIKNIRYYKSQPWPLSGSMMVGFVAEADENQFITIDELEIVEAAWFNRGNLPKHPPNLSIAGEMIEQFEKGEL